MWDDCLEMDKGQQMHANQDFEISSHVLEKIAKYLKSKDIGKIITQEIPGLAK
jgi:hypothetical protein